MSVEIHQPEIEALIEQRMASGAFHDVEEVLLDALRSAPVATAPMEKKPRRMGTELIAAMQAMPYKEVDLEPSCLWMPVREPEF